MQSRHTYPSKLNRCEVLDDWPPIVTVTGMLKPRPPAMMQSMWLWFPVAGTTAHRSADGPVPTVTTAPLLPKFVPTMDTTNPPVVGPGRTIS